MADEHLRLELYRMARSRLPVEQLLSVVLADPDIVMADAALVELIDEVGGSRTFEVFSEWASIVLDAGVGGRAFPAKRIQEWRALLLLDSPTSDDLGQLLAGSDWLQRKAAEHTNLRGVLQTLAQGGRTKRTRAIAGRRLRSLGGGGTT